MYVCLITQSCPTVTPWTVARQGPLSMEFSGQEYRSGLPFPSPVLHMMLYICQSKISQFVPPSLSPLCQHVYSLHLCLYSCPANGFICTIFSRFHLYAFICSISFSLSDFLHSVWQTLGSCTLLQMTQFSSFLWLSNIPLWASQVVQW